MLVSHPSARPVQERNRGPEAGPARAFHRLATTRVLLVACAAGALGLAAVTDQPAHHLWGLVAGTGYLLLAATPLARHPFAPWAAAAVGAVVPLAVLVLARAGLPGHRPFAQPEVHVIEDAARRFLATGSPYPTPAETAMIAGPDGYFPYLPGMALFGLPRALFGEAWWTDTRIMFAAVAVTGCVIGVRALVRAGAGRAGPATGWLLAGNPLVGLTVATGGHDLALAGLLVAAVGLAPAVTRDPRAAPVAGVVAGAAAAVKPTAWPVAVVLLVLLAHTGARGAAVRFAAAATGPVLLLCLPAVLRAPRLPAEHLVVFPAGLAAVPTPAASPVPGAWVAVLPGGRAIALGLLLVAVVLALGLLLARPPADAAATARFAAASLAAGMLLAPSSRVGWFVVPLLLAGLAAAAPRLRARAGAPF